MPHGSPGASTAPAANADSAKASPAASGNAAAPNPAPQNPPARTTIETQPSLPLLPIGAIVLAIGLAALVFHAAARRTAGR